MSKISSCPDPEELERYLRGQVAGQEADVLESHLLECVHCTELATQAAAQDELTLALRRGLSTVADDQNATLRALVSRCRELPIWAADVPARLHEDLSADDTRWSSHFLRLLDPATHKGDLGTLSKYRVLRQLGIGANGVVFDAIDTTLQRPVAIKVMRPERLSSTSTARERFEREAQLAAALHDEHVVRIYDVSHIDGIPYIVMERLAGETLDDCLMRTPVLPLEVALHLTKQVLLGLAAAHRVGLLHRDIKPANIWLTNPMDSESSESNRLIASHTTNIKILDFGLARPLDRDIRLTQDGTILGTPGYWSPEQATGKATDARSDLFSVGCVLYRMLTGQLPFQGSDLLSYLLALAEGKLVPVSERNSAIPKPIDRLAATLLAKDREDRPSSAADAIQLLDIIEREAAEPVQIPPSSRASTNPWRPRSLRRWVGLAVLPIAVWMAITRIQTESGTIVITGIDNDVEVEILHQDDQPRVLIVDKKTESMLDVTPGRYELRARFRDGVEFSTSKPIDVVRGEKIAVRVEYLLREASDATTIKPAASLDARPVSLRVDREIGGRFLRHYRSIYCIAAGPDSETCVTGAADGLLRLWDLKTRTLRAEADAHARIVTSVAIHPRDGRIVSSGLDGLVKIWNQNQADAPRNGLQLAHTLVLPDIVSLVRLSAKGDFLAAMTEDGITLYDMTTYERWKSIEFRSLDSNQPHGLAFLHHSDQFVVRSPRALRLFDATSGEQVREYPLGDHSPLSVAVDANDKLAAIGMMAPKPTIQVLELATGKIIKSFDYSNVDDEPIYLEFSPDGKQLLAIRGRRASGPDSDPSETNAISQWSLTEDDVEPIHIKSPVYNSGFLTATYSRDGEQIIAGSRDVWGTLWRARSGERVIVDEPAPFSSMAVSARGLIAAGAFDGRIHLYRPDASKPSLLEGHESYVFDMDIRNDDQALASSSTDGTVRTWDLATLENRWTSRQWSTGVQWFTGANSVLVAGRWYAQVPSFLSEASGTMLPAGSFLAGSSVNCIAVTESTLMATGSAHEPVRLWNATHRQAIGTLPMEASTSDVGANCMAFSPDGTLLAVGYDAIGTSKRRISLWDVASRRLLATQEVADGRLMTLAFHPKQEYLATGSWDTPRVQIWETRTLRALGETTLGPFGAGIAKIGFVDSGEQLAALVSDGRIIVLDCQRDDRR